MDASIVAYIIYRGTYIPSLHLNFKGNIIPQYIAVNFTAIKILRLFTVVGGAYMFKTFITVGQLERFLEDYLTENNTSVGTTLSNNSKLIDNSINLFRLTKEEETILRKKYFSPSATRDDIKRYILNAYLEYKLIDYSNYRSINKFKKMLID